ncbi:M23 family metallopeptidase [Streptomyces cyaneofuscatus]|uniref:M23 family metallopeptidase n=1 Tax=Streptomyces cyaneofuscatus TaxID=66883 RepID=UPI003446D23B
MTQKPNLARHAGRLLTAGAVALALGAGMTQAANSAPGEAVAVGAEAKVQPKVQPKAQPKKPKFQLPFECGTAWQLNTWGHNPALDIVVHRNTGSDGKKMRASAAGKVASTYWNKGSGNTVQINHGGGWFTAYYHLKDKHNKYVKKGDKVQSHTQIGRIGSSGGTGWAHLHFEQRYKKGATSTAEKDRVPVYFNGKKYTGSGAEWKKVISHNCSKPKPTRWCTYKVVKKVHKRSWAGTKYASEGTLSKGAKVTLGQNGTSSPGGQLWQRAKLTGGADNKGPWVRGSSQYVKKVSPSCR